MAAPAAIPVNPACSPKAHYYAEKSDTFKRVHEPNLLVQILVGQCSRQTVRCYYTLVSHDKRTSAYLCDWCVSYSLWAIFLYESFSDLHVQGHTVGTTFILQHFKLQDMALSA